MFVLQVRFHILLLSQEYATQDVYLLLKENFSEFSCAEFFTTKGKYFLPFRGVTVLYLVELEPFRPVSQLLRVRPKIGVTVVATSYMTTRIVLYYLHAVLAHSDLEGYKRVRCSIIGTFIS